MLFSSLVRIVPNNDDGKKNAVSRDGLVLYFLGALFLLSKANVFVIPADLLPTALVGNHVHQLRASTIYIVLFIIF